MFRNMINILIGIGIFYLVLLLVLFIFQKQFVFHPEVELHYTPADLGMAYESVTFETIDEEDIHGWFIPHESARATILYFHGNAGNMSDRVQSLQMLYTLRLNIFIIDYRGYGKSTGRPNEAGTYRDATAAWKYLTVEKQIPADEILVYGRSLGGAIAIELATRVEPAALIVGSTFTSAKDIARKMFPYVPIAILMSISYNSVKRIKQIHVPLLVTHSENDDLIPFYLGQRLFQAANEPKRFVKLSGGHNDNIYVSRDRYLSEIDRFIKEYVDMRST